MVGYAMEQRSSVDDDIALLQRMIDGPDVDLADFVSERPYLRSADDAREHLAGLIVGLEDVRAGRVVPHAQVVRDALERRRRGQTQAAE